MQILIVLLVVAAAVSQTWPNGAAGTRSGPLPVRSVIDGGTIDIVGVGRVRLLGIVAPKASRRSEPPPLAREARQRLLALVGNRWVRLEREDAGVSSRLAYVIREDGLFVNAEMVRDGLARVSARSSGRRIGELRQAEDEARRYRRGMWGSAPRTPPAGYTAPSAGRRSAPPYLETILSRSPSNDAGHPS